jgi:H+/Cl- antiporter ClcA
MKRIFVQFKVLLLACIFWGILFLSEFVQYQFMIVVGDSITSKTQSWLLSLPIGAICGGVAMFLCSRFLTRSMSSLSLFVLLSLCLLPAIGGFFILDRALWTNAVIAISAQVLGLTIGWYMQARNKRNAFKR